jgi:hypothetical protein
MRALQCPSFGWTAAAAAALGVGFAADAGAEVLVMEMVSVTGTLYAVESPDAGDGTLEIYSDLGDRYRIDVDGLGAALLGHVGEAVTVVAFIEPSDEKERPLLRVERFTLHGS